MKNKLFFLLLSLAVFLFPLISKAEAQKIALDSTAIEYGLPSSQLIEAIMAKPKEKSLDLTWQIKDDALIAYKERNYTLAIAYREASLAKDGESNKDEYAWESIKDIALDQSEFEVKDLKENTSYLFRIGINDGSEIHWSDINTAKTGESWGLFNFLILVGSLALFLYGMKVMSDGLQQAAGSKLRNLLGSITSNPFKGVLTGFGITALIQSSSITTVMTVSFVNAGLMTLKQSAGVIMGANIGTTFTAWIIDIFGFKVDISPYTLIMLAIGLPLMFMRGSRAKGLANTVIGFAFLFMGLSFLKDAVPVLGPESALVQFFISINNTPIIGLLIFVIFGALLTVIIQSSSGTIALTMALMANGVIPFEVGAAMVLGENIGTTVTAELAASVGNVYAKRTARIHSTFNVVGVLCVLLVFPFFLKGVSFLTELIDGGNPMLNPGEHGSAGLAVLHSAFNLANVFVMIWFIPSLVKFAERTVKPRDKQDERFQLDFIGKGPMSTPNLSILEAKKEIAKFGKITGKMSEFARELLFGEDKKRNRELIERIIKYEEITDKVEVEVANYLNTISSGNLSKDLAVRIRGMNSTTNDLERIGDIFYQIAKGVERKNENKINFTAQQEERLREMFDLLDEAFAIMCENLNKHIADVTLDEAKKIEDKINRKRDEIRREYYDSLSNNGDVNIESGILYNNMFASLERIGDHIINVTEAVVGKV
ncbi:MAG TPA: Na/Pi symporter [Sphingobacterium sp.]|nr:Na/Pi symporter [Sphingobacterium sp.]